MARFPKTRWSFVLAAGVSTPESRQAMGWLCQAYWYPLYAFVRRSGYSEDAAQDVVQGFFAKFLERDYVRSLEPGGAPFRSYLRGAMDNYLKTQHARRKAAKRGGGVPDLSLEIDGAHGERRYLVEPSHEETAEVLFERRWTCELLDRALNNLALHFCDRGESQQYAVLKSFLPGSQEAMAYQDAADQLGVSLQNVKVTIHRLRKRYRECLRFEVAQTLADPETVDKEISYLLSCL